MSETPEDAVLKLIDKVDNGFEKRLWKIYLSFKVNFRYYFPIIVAAYYLTLFTLLMYMLSLVLKAFPSLSQQPSNVQIAISIALVAAFTAIASFGVNIQKAVEPVKTDEMLLDYNYKILQEGVADENIAILKGLVLLKSKHPELSLKQFLELPITKDKLFDMLYK